MKKEIILGFFKKVLLKSHTQHYLEYRMHRKSAAGPSHKAEMQISGTFAENVMSCVVYSILLITEMRNKIGKSIIISK